MASPTSKSTRRAVSSQASRSVAGAAPTANVVGAIDDQGPRLASTGDGLSRNTSRSFSPGRADPSPAAAATAASPAARSDDDASIQGARSLSDVSVSGDPHTGWPRSATGPSGAPGHAINAPGPRAEVERSARPVHLPLMTRLPGLLAAAALAASSALALPPEGKAGRHEPRWTADRLRPDPVGRRRAGRAQGPGRGAGRAPGLRVQRDVRDDEPRRRARPARPSRTACAWTAPSSRRARASP